MDAKLKADLKDLKKVSSRDNIGRFLKGIETTPKIMEHVRLIFVQFERRMNGRNWRQAKLVWDEMYSSLPNSQIKRAISRGHINKILDSRSTYLKMLNWSGHIKNALDNVAKYSSRIEAICHAALVAPEAIASVADLKNHMAGQNITSHHMKEAYDRMNAFIKLVKVGTVFMPPLVDTVFGLYLDAFEAVGGAVKLFYNRAGRIGKHSGAINKLGEKINGTKPGAPLTAGASHNIIIRNKLTPSNQVWK